MGHGSTKKKQGFPVIVSQADHQYIWARHYETLFHLVIVSLSLFVPQWEGSWLHYWSTICAVYSMLMYRAMVCTIRFWAMYLIVNGKISCMLIGDSSGHSGFVMRWLWLNVLSGLCGYHFVYFAWCPIMSRVGNYYVSYFSWSLPARWSPSSTCAALGLQCLLKP